MVRLQCPSDSIADNSKATADNSKAIADNSKAIADELFRAGDYLGHHQLLDCC